MKLKGQHPVCRRLNANFDVKIAGTVVKITINGNIQTKQSIQTCR